MLKKNGKYIVILVLCLVILVMAQSKPPRRINWKHSYSKTEAVPYGNSALFALLPDIFPGQSVKTNYKTLYEIHNGDDSVWRNKNFIFIEDDFSPQEEDTRALLYMVASGCQVFIASHHINGPLSDSLGLETELNRSFLEEAEVLAGHDSLNNDPGLNFSNPSLRSPRDYYCRKGDVSYYFSKGDSVNSRILGVNSVGAPVFIAIRYGEGTFLLHSVPLAFTNYNLLLRNNSEYIARALSYLPQRSLVWDEYYKQESNRSESSSPLRYFLSQEPLRWALFLLMALALLFMLFRARRMQRMIPVVRPPQNTSLEFVRTIGKLYFQHGDHKDLAEKKIAYFHDFVRNHLYLDTRHLSHKELGRKIAAKTGLETEKINRLMSIIAEAEGSRKLSEQQLRQLSSQIEEFYSLTKTTVREKQDKITH